MQSVIWPSSKAIFVLKALTRAEIEVLREWLLSLSELFGNTEKCVMVHH